MNNNNDITVALTEKNSTLNINNYQLYKLNDLSSNDYSTYKMIIEIDGSQLTNAQNNYTKLTVSKNNKKYSLPIGSIIIEKVNYEEVPTNINIMATLFSTDGISFNVVVENKTNSELTIKDLYYNLFFDHENYNNPIKENFIIPSNKFEEKNYILNEKLKEKHIVIRPIITYFYKDKKYSTLSHAPIYFNTPISE